MPNAWVEFVRQYAKDNNISYGCAISEAGPAYRQMKAMNEKPKEKKKEKKTITINKEKMKIIKDYEIDLQQYANAYNSFIDGFVITGRKIPPMKQKEVIAIKNEYDKYKNKLEELTNKKYPELKDEATIREEYKKTQPTKAVSKKKNDVKKG